MTDVHSPAVRSKNMQAIRHRDTKPELLVRKALYARGFRYRLHVKTLPGTPDLVFPQYRSVIFVHGCFWHRHDCSFFKLPQTRTEFWRTKIDGNVRRDKVVIAALEDLGWRWLIVWECELKKKNDALEVLIDGISEWISAGRNPPVHSL